MKKNFPYINGKLFRDPLPMAYFDSSMREILLECCGMDWSKISPAQSQNSTTDSFKEWFNNNVAWVAPIFTIVSGAIGLLLKYNDVKNFCLSHCCHKESETTETGTLDEKLL
jgi:hypothetical protein